MLYVNTEALCGFLELPLNILSGSREELEIGKMQIIPMDRQPSIHRSNLYQPGRRQERTKTKRRM